MEQRIAVAGFGPFGAHAVNPSEQIVRALGGRGLVTTVLPVSYRRAEAELLAWLDAVQPAALLLLGVAACDGLRLERVALNLDDAPAPDVDGERRSGSPIRPGGAVGHWSTLPLDAFAEALAARGVPFAWSRDAGAFLCNHAFYVARDWVERSGRTRPCGFVHLPPLDALPFARQLEGVEACLERLASRLAADRGRAAR